MTKTHLMTDTKIYHSWRAMIQRCYYKKHKYYEKYGGRGIKICNDWKESFQKFYEWATKNGYREGLSIDRTANNGNYRPENCRWSDRYTQNRNRKSNIFLEYKGEKLCIQDWSKKIGIEASTLRHRYKIGWRTERILTQKVTPNGK